MKHCAGILAERPATCVLELQALLAALAGPAGAALDSDRAWTRLSERCGDAVDSP